MTRPFTNAITGSNGALIRDRIKSPNFVSGVAGWSINKDGSVEFLNGVLRGDLVVGGLTPPNMEITETIPAELVTFYAAQWGGTIANFVVIEATSANDYRYQVTLSVSSQGPAHAEGWSRSGNVTETWFEPAPSATGDWVRIFGDVTSGTFKIFGNIILGDPTDPTNNISWGNESLPRGYVGFASLTSFTFNSTTSTTEQLALTTVSMTFPAGRAFQFRVRGFKKSATAQAPGFNVHKTNLAGTTLIGGRVDIPLTGFDLEEIREGIFVNSTAADVTAALAIGIQPSTAVIVTFETGTGGNSGWYEVVDIGDATQYIGRPSV